jgi:hypothetical protein
MALCSNRRILPSRLDLGSIENENETKMNDKQPEDVFTLDSQIPLGLEYR